jgi:ketosteroid isomerase-like protein
MSDAADAVRRFYAAMNRRDADAILACYDAGAEIQVTLAGRAPRRHAASRDAVEGYLSAFPELVFEVHRLAADGDTVEAEVSSAGRLANGAPYRARYHNRFVVRDGLIAVFHESPEPEGGRSFTDSQIERAPGPGRGSTRPRP